MISSLGLLRIRPKTFKSLKKALGQAKDEHKHPPRPQTIARLIVQTRRRKQAQHRLSKPFQAAVSGLPQANKPTAMTPHKPLPKCTGTAPTGSSIRHFSSKTEQGTPTPRPPRQ